MITLTVGQPFFTNHGESAFKIKEGKASIYLVPEQQGVQGRPLHLADVDAEFTLPGVSFTDSEYTHWRIMLKTDSSCAVQEIEGASTKVLKRRFLEAVDVNQSSNAAFEQQLIEEYKYKIIKDDVFIQKTEHTREQAREHTEETIAKATEAAEVDRSDGQTAASDGGEKRVQFLSAKETAFMVVAACALLVTAVAAIVCAVNQRLFLALILVFLFITVRFLRSIRLDSFAGKKAGALYEESCRRIFGGGAESARVPDKLAAAAAILNAGEVVRRMMIVEAQLMEAGVLSAGIAILLIIADIKIAVLLIALTAIAGASVLFLHQIADKKEAAMEDCSEEAEAALHEYFGNIEKIRLAGAEEQAIDTYFEWLASGRTIARSAQTARQLSDIIKKALYWIIPLIVIAVIYIMPSLKIFGSWIVILLGGVTLAAEGLTFFLGLSESRTYGSRMQRILDETGASFRSPDEPMKETAEADDSGRTADDSSPLIQMVDVAFAYGENKVFEGVSLSVNEGEVVCISGPSGCGKSTLIRILAGSEPSFEGTFLYRGVPVGRQNVDLIREKMGIVMQNDQLLPGSISENIVCGNPDMKNETIFHAMTDAELLDDVMEMPMKTETLIGEDGDVISSGQKQKVLIAKALAREPELLLLDEAFSELNCDVQSRILQHVRRRGTTCVLVTHDDAIKMQCDRIIEL